MTTREERNNFGKRKGRGEEDGEVHDLAVVLE